MEEKDFKNCVNLLSKNPEKTKELYSLLQTHNELSQESFIRELEKIKRRDVTNDKQH